MFIIPTAMLSTIVPMLINIASNLPLLCPSFNNIATGNA